MSDLRPIGQVSGIIEMIDENTVNTEEEVLNFTNKYGFVTLFPLRKVVFQTCTKQWWERTEKRNFIKHGVGRIT